MGLGCNYRFSQLVLPVVLRSSVNMQRCGDGALALFNVKHLVDNGVLHMSGTWQINTSIMSLDPPVYKRCHTTVLFMHCIFRDPSRYLFGSICTRKARDFVKTVSASLK